MRMLILFLFSLSISAQEIDLSKLNQEMELLRNTAFVSAENESEESTDTNQSLSLQRKPLVSNNHQDDPSFMDLEKKYFDNVSFELAAPEREKPEKSEGKPPSKPTKGFDNR